MSRKKNEWKIACEHINALELKRVHNACTLPKPQERASASYPITNMICELELDRVYVGRALKNLESKGNLGARELLFEDIMELEHNLSYNDLLQEFRLELMEQESKSALSLVYDMERKNYKIVAMRAYTSDFMNIVINGKAYKPIIEEQALEEYNKALESELFKALFSSVTKYLYEHKTVIEKKHISYDIELESGEHKLVDMLDRKALAQYAKSEELKSDKEFKGYLKKVEQSTNIEELKRKRLDIIDGLCDGLTYQEIANTYGYSLSSIGDNVKVVRELYKNYFGIHKRSTSEQLSIELKSANRAQVLNLLDIKKSNLESKKLKSAFPEYHIELVFGHDYLGIGAQESKFNRFQKELHQERALERELKSSSIKPHKSKFEKSEKLYIARKEHCQKRSIRDNVLRYESALRRELERIERYESTSAQEHGAINYKRSKSTIQVFYGKKLVHEYKIAK